MTALNMAGIKVLLRRHSKSELARAWGISLPTMRRYCKGGPPLSRTVADHINACIDKLLANPITFDQALTKYLNDFANHRLSVNVKVRGIDCPAEVLRFPLVELHQRFEQDEEIVYVSGWHFEQWLRTRYPDDQIRLRQLLPEKWEIGKNLAAGTGLPRCCRAVYRLDVAKYPQALAILRESAARPDPEQDGVVLLGSIADSARSEA